MQIPHFLRSPPSGCCCDKILAVAFFLHFFIACLKLSSQYSGKNLKSSNQKLDFHGSHSVRTNGRRASENDSPASVGIQSLLLHLRRHSQKKRTKHQQILPGIQQSQTGKEGGLRRKFAEHCSDKLGSKQRAKAAVASQSVK